MKLDGLLQRRWLVGVAVMMMVAGCARAGDGPETVGAGQDGRDRLLQQAHDALTRYDQAVGAAGGGGRVVPVTPPSWDPYHPPGGLAIESATGTLAGRQLTVTFTGAPAPASQPCGIDYTAEAVESDKAVVVIVREHRHAADEACPDVGAPRTAIVDLAQPLGERAVLEVQQGLPVALTITG